MLRTTKKDIAIQLKKIAWHIDQIAPQIGVRPFGNELTIETWTPGDSNGTRYQLAQQEKDHTGALRWQGRYYTIAEMDGALELCNKILNELTTPIAANKAK